MEKNTGEKNATLYRSLIQACKKLCLHKTPKALLEKLIWYHVNREAIFVGQKKLALELGVSIRTIERAFKTLYDSNLLIKMNRKSPLKTNRYILAVDVFLVPLSKKTAPSSSFSEKQMAGQMTGNIYRNKKALKGMDEPLKKEEDAGENSCQVISFQPPKDQELLAQEMIQIMAQETENVIQPDSSYGCTVRKLAFHLKYRCGGDMERWRAFCKRVGSSDYLMGRSNGFTPPLLWLIKDQTIEKMRNGEFHRKPKKTFFEEYAQRGLSGRHENPRAIEESSDQEIEKEIALKRQNRALNLSEIENQHYRQIFEDKMAQEDSWIADEFRNRGWDSSFIKSAFLDFKINAVCGSFKEELGKVLSEKSKGTTKQEQAEHQTPFRKRIGNKNGYI